MLGRWDRWVFHQDRRREWRWTRFAGAEVVGKSSEGYHHRQDCEANAARLGFGRSSWPLSASRDRWLFFRDTRGLWRWRRQARNGEIVGAAHKGFRAREACEANARRHGWQAQINVPRAQCCEAAGEWKTCAG